MSGPWATSGSRRVVMWPVMPNRKATISDISLTLNQQWCIPQISQHLMNDLNLKVQGVYQLGYRLTGHVSESNLSIQDKTDVVSTESRPMKFYSHHTFQLRQQKPLHRYMKLCLNLGDCDPFVPLSFSRLSTVQTTDATITLFSQFIPCAAFVELPNVLPNVNKHIVLQIDRCG